MRYRQIDRITVLDPPDRLVGERTLRADEDYLKDHFPRLPVMPGVMMLEALHQAARWLMMTTHDFAGPVPMLLEVKAVKFGDFLSPGETLIVEATHVKTEGTTSTFKTAARKGDRVTVSARLVMQRCPSGDPPEDGTDADIERYARRQFFELFGDDVAVATWRSQTA